MPNSRLPAGKVEKVETTLLYKEYSSYVPDRRLSPNEAFEYMPAHGFPESLVAILDGFAWGWVDTEDLGFKNVVPWMAAQPERWRAEMAEAEKVWKTRMEEQKRREDVRRYEIRMNTKMW